MKKLLSFLAVILIAYLYLNNRCIAFGYDNIVISKELLCSKVIVSEQYQYETVKYTPLKELEGDAKDYKPTPTPFPTLNSNQF
jgi:hypothetical protein